ncbi:MAG: hypothetical protein ACRCY8_12750 [Dermatophilaceae bacterium]
MMTMPRNVGDILKQARELAKRFESYDPDPTDELDADAVAALRAATLERSTAEKHLLDAVRRPRSAGLSWSAIGAVVSTSGEVTRQRYAGQVA